MMVSNQPYLLRAFYEWIVDSHCTPHILVDATLPDVNVPVDYVQDGRIVLNVAMQAVEGLNLGNEWVTFFARFSGRQTYIEVPMHAIKGIYAKENGEGIAFQSPSEDEQKARKQHEQADKSGVKPVSSRRDDGGEKKQNPRRNESKAKLKVVK